MTTRALLLSAIAAVSAWMAGCSPSVRPSDPLPSWNDGAAKQAVLGFVDRVTTAQSPGFVPTAERIAVFDNDGTLWSEQPMYVQLAFAIDRVRALAPQHPEWQEQEPFASLLAGDSAAALAGGEAAVARIVMATHAGMTSEEFTAIVADWMAAARHPVTGRPYTAMVYQPMLELLAYLRANGFQTFVVSGGGIEFMRPWTEPVYGVPPEQVVGSSIVTRYEVRDGRPVLVRLPEIDFVNDKSGKPVGIHRHVGRRPILAFGNSDGDFEMLEWTTTGSGPRLGLLLHHDDGGREVAYDRESPVGRLDRGLAEAGRRGWVLVSMKDDWTTVFGEYPPQHGSAKR
jgi:haloacid dehalogenase-like hydrolase